ncbi:MAG: hypothetical protein RJA59_1607, partial [Pseudomonadota bacterium]
GLAFGLLLGFLTDRSWDLGRGAWRWLGIGALATSAATLAYTIRDSVAGFASGTPGELIRVSTRSVPEFATWILGSLLVGILVDRRDRDRAAAARRERQLREARDAALRARLAPHFLFNAFSTLQAQIGKDPAAASATTEALARLFRQALEVAGRPRIPLGEELEFVESYLGIERARLGHRLQVNVDVPEELEEVEIPPLSLQVLVENAVRHGIAPREDGGEVRIRARRSGPGENPGIVLSVENPLAASSRPGTGNGLETLRGRLAVPSDLTLSTANGVHRAEFWWSTA